MNHERQRGRQRKRRKLRVRKRLRGTPERPRLNVFRSHKHVYAQVVDDLAGQTLMAASTRDKDLRDSVSYGGNCSAAEAVGKAIAERAMASGVKKVAFDRGPYQYHGRIAALAKAAREVGLKM